jgi:arylsulfatase A-like enzyme
MIPSRIYRPIPRESEFAQPVGLVSFLANVAWLGLLFGVAESLLAQVRRLVDRRIVAHDLWTNDHAAWLAPLSLGLCLLLVGYPLFVLIRLRSRFAARATPVVLIGLGAWSAISAIQGLDPWARLALALGVAVRLGSSWRIGSETMARRNRQTLPWLVSIWVILGAVCGIGSATAEWRGLATLRPPTPHAPNVVLIVLDTVRAESLSLYGYDRPTSPGLAQWAKQGIRFEDAYATSPYTLATHASLFTGRWPAETSARTNIALDGRYPTLAETLRERGYATGAFVGNSSYGNARYGLDRGFSHYEESISGSHRRVSVRELMRSSALGELVLGWSERILGLTQPTLSDRLDARLINERALAWIDQRVREKRPFFTFLNYIDAHDPFSIPADAPVRWSRVDSDHLMSLHDEIMRLEVESARTGDLRVATRLEEARREYAPLVRDAYDSCIAWLDSQVDRLLQGLDERALLENTIVVITSDHGELLGEHGAFSHGHSLHRPLLHVPLVVLGYGLDARVRGQSVAEPVSIRNVRSTVLDLARVEAGDPRSGRSLRPHWEGGGLNERPEELVFAQMERLHYHHELSRYPATQGELSSVINRTHAYTRQECPSGEIREWLYERAIDPAELNNLAGEPSQAARLAESRKRLAAIRGETP